MSKLHDLLSNNSDDEEILSLIDAGADVNEANTEDCYIRPLQIAVNGRKSEQIIGAPIIAGDTCTVICKEQRRTWRKVYKMPQFRFAMQNIIGQA